MFSLKLQAIYSGKKLLVPTEQEEGWSLETACLDISEKRQIYYFCWESNYDSSVLQLTA
jgi:hypothetical protein